MAAGKYIRIYRKLVPADTFATLGATEKIELNVNGTDNNIANMWSKGYQKGASHGLAEHPNPNENLSEQQDTGKDEDVFTIPFSISRSDLVMNQFLINLESWDDEDVDGQENLDLPFGRFSIEFEDNPHFDYVATAAQGLEMRSLDYTKDPEVQNELSGILVLSKGKQAVWYGY